MTSANDFFSASKSDIQYRHPLRVNYTEGVKELVEKCEAYWMLDLIASQQFRSQVKKELFQSWQLTRTKNSSFEIIATDNYGQAITSQQIPFSDFPYDKVTLWCICRLIMLPWEF